MPEVGTRKSPPELTDRVSLSHGGRHARGKVPKGASNNEAAATMPTPGQFDVPNLLKPDFIRNHVPILGTRPPRV